MPNIKIDCKHFNMCKFCYSGEDLAKACGSCESYEPEIKLLTIDEILKWVTEHPEVKVSLSYMHSFGVLVTVKHARGPCAQRIVKDNSEMLKFMLDQMYELVMNCARSRGINKEEVEK